MSSSSFEFKVVVAGPFGVGKTTLITNISNTPVVGTEVPTTGDEAGEKDSTTVGLEYGVLEVEAGEFDIKLLLYGTPGQTRFRFMWEAVSVGAEGFVFLVDASKPDTWAEARELIAFFMDRPDIPWIVGANRANAAGPEACDRLAEFLGLDDNVPLVPCDLADSQSSRDVMVALLGRIIGDEGETHDENGVNHDDQSNDRSDADVDPNQADGDHRALAGRN